MKTILSSFYCELLQKLKQPNTVCLLTIIGKEKYKIEEKSNTKTVKTNLPYTSPFRIINQFLSFL